MRKIKDRIHERIKLEPKYENQPELMKKSKESFNILIPLLENDINLKLVEDYMREIKDKYYIIGLPQPNSYDCIETNIKDYIISSCFIKKLSLKSAELDSLDKKLKFYKYFPFYFIFIC